MSTLPIINPSNGNVWYSLCYKEYYYLDIETNMSISMKEMLNSNRGNLIK
jgi:hypothetical protein